MTVARTARRVRRQRLNNLHHLSGRGVPRQYGAVVQSFKFSPGSGKRKGGSK